MSTPGVEPNMIQRPLRGSQNTWQGRPQGGRASLPRNRKNVVENGYFPELYKMIEVQEDGIENG